ncbi:hypothetical protein EZV62_027888 [Acer yangbiense]|uniref:Uncharacterized protein n=1 Tax=Acer yangbiense TaxID=1000413 RepID=A0A5C7GPZ7_9ROSI|nr:hypothetical protein EZV62_027888 [Acer yangbiense]
MSSYDHNQPQVAYPPPSTRGGPFVAPLPPVGYPTKEGHGHGFAYSQNALQSRPSLEAMASGRDVVLPYAVAVC